MISAKRSQKPSKLKSLVKRFCASHAAIYARERPTLMICDQLAKIRPMLGVEDAPIVVVAGSGFDSQELIREPQGKARTDFVICTTFEKSLLRSGCDDR
jgi:hypothetical protein